MLNISVEKFVNFFEICKIINVYYKNWKFSKYFTYYESNQIIYDFNHTVIF